MLQRLKRSSFIHSLALPTLLALCAANFSHAQASAPDSAAVDAAAPVAEAVLAAPAVTVEAPAAPAVPVVPATPVTLVKPKSALWPDQIEAAVSIMPWQETHIGSEIGGLRLADVAISVGDTVSKGQVLARLDTATVEMDLEAANAQL
ncbi:MAG: biotin/lipoyl-binding protein, partial [Propionivibrio sp.]|nr:biotin/lipoyl-binding protein [Propionivibrio sp.]